MTEYRVVIGNRFADLDQSEDPFEKLAKLEKVKAEKKSLKAKKNAEAKKVVPIEDAPKDTTVLQVSCAPPSVTKLTESLSISLECATTITVEIDSKNSTISNNGSNAETKKTKKAKKGKTEEKNISQNKDVKSSLPKSEENQSVPAQLDIKSNSSKNSKNGKQRSSPEIKETATKPEVRTGENLAKKGKHGGQKVNQEPVKKLDESVTAKLKIDLKEENQISSEIKEIATKSVPAEARSEDMKVSHDNDDNSVLKSVGNQPSKKVKNSSKSDLGNGSNVAKAEVRTGENLAKKGKNAGQKVAPQNNSQKIDYKVAIQNRFVAFENNVDSEDLFKKVAKLKEVKAEKRHLKAKKTSAEVEVPVEVAPIDTSVLQADDALPSKLTESLSISPECPPTTEVEIDSKNSTISNNGSDAETKKTKKVKKGKSEEKNLSQNKDVESPLPKSEENQSVPAQLDIKSNRSKNSKNGKQKSSPEIKETATKPEIRTGENLAKKGKHAGQKVDQEPAKRLDESVSAKLKIDSKEENQNSKSKKNNMSVKLTPIEDKPEEKKNVSENIDAKPFVPKSDIAKIMRGKLSKPRKVKSNWNILNISTSSMFFLGAISLIVLFNLIYNLIEIY